MKNKINLLSNFENAKLNPRIVYGGDLDLVHGAKINESSAKQIESNLRFAALFFEYIAIHDGCIHCYGPLHFVLTSRGKGVSP